VSPRLSALFAIAFLLAAKSSSSKKWRNGTTEGGALKTISFGGPGGRAYSLACPSGGYGLYKVYGWWKDELFGSTVVSHDISCRTA
jgi:uncharacterized membrane protein